MKKNENIRILVVDDHPALRMGLITMINGQPDMEVVAEAGDGPAAVAAFQRCLPELTLLDLRLPGLSGVEVIEAVKAIIPDCRVIILTTFDCEHDVSRALRAGAQSYLLKDVASEELLEAIRAVHAGRRHIPSRVALRLADHMSHGELTRRELDVLAHLVQGRSNKEIGGELNLTEETVKGYMKTLFAKLGAADRVQAAMRALQRGLVHLD